MLYRLQEHILRCAACGIEEPFTLRIEYARDGKEITAFGSDPQLEDNIFREFRYAHEDTTWRICHWDKHRQTIYVCCDHCQGKLMARDYFCGKTKETLAGAFEELDKMQEPTRN